MKKFQNLFAFGTLAVAAVLFAGCGSADSDAGGGDTGGSGTTATSDEGGEAGGGSDTSSTTVTTGDYQVVTLNVPKMT